MATQIKSVFVDHRFLVAVLCALSIIGIVIVPSVGDVSVIDLWTNIGLLNYWRLLSAIGLATFFPGYFVLSILARRKKVAEFSFAEKLGPSFLLSLMITASLAFVLFSANISYAASVLIFALVNAVILAFYILLAYGARATSEFNCRLGSFALDKVHLLLLVTFGFFLVTDIVLHISLNTILVGGDMMTSSATAMSILRRHSPLFETSVIQDIAGASSACYFYLVYLAFFFLLSGAPPMNATFALMPLFQIVFIIAFYQMVRVFFKKNGRMIAALSTLFVFLFGGFVLLSAIFRGGMLSSLSSTNPQIPSTFFDDLSRANVQIGRIPMFVDLTFGLRSLLPGIVSFFVLGYVFRKKDFSNWLKAAIIFSAIIVGYLMHQVDVLIFFAVLSPVIVLLSGQKSLVHLRSCLVYSLIAFVAIALFDFSLPNQFYTLQIQFLLAIGVIILSLLAVLVRSTKPRFIERIIASLKNSKNIWLQSDKTKLILSGVILYFYVLAFFFWVDSPIRTDDWMLVPWYFYPIKFGIAGLLAVGGVIFAIFSKFYSKSLVRFMLYTALVFLLAKFTTGALGLYYAFAETRFMFYIFIGVSIVAAYFFLRLITFLSENNMKPKLIGGLLVAGVFVSGISESVVTVSYWKSSGMWQVPYDVTAGELDAINYLRLNRPVNEYVAIVADEAWISRANVILSGAALNYLEFPEQLFMEQDPGTALNFLNYWRVRYIYMPTRDIEFINLYKPAYKEGFVLKDLLKYLPIVFENEEVKIYEIPRSENVSGSVSLVVPASFILLTTTALSGVAYSEYLGTDHQLFSSTSTILLDDFAVSYIPLQQITWETMMGAKLKMDQNAANLTLQTEVEGPSFPGALLDIEDLKLNGSQILFFNYKTDSLPSEAVYYFEILDVNHERIYNAELSPSTDAFSQQYYEVPDLSGAKWLWIGMSTIDSSQFPPTLQFKEIGFLKPQLIAKDPSILSTMNLNVGDYVDWVRQGGKLIVFGDERGAFANLLSIYPAESTLTNGAVANESRVSLPQAEITKTFSNDSTVSVLASFTVGNEPVAPLAYAKPIGTGEIIYLDTSSYLHAIEDSAQSDDLLSNFTSFFKLIEPEFTSSSVNKSKSLYAFVSWPVFTGQVAVETDFVKFVTRREILDEDIRRQVFLPSSFEVDSIRLHIVHQVASQGAESRVFSAASVKEFQFQSGAVKVSASNVTVVDGYGKYSLLSISNSFNMSISDGANLEMVIEENGKLYDININEGSVELNGIDSSSQLLLLVSNPSIVAQGEVSLPWATIWEATSTKSDVIAVTWKSPAHVSGLMSLQMDYSGTLIHAYNLKINGSVEAERQIEWWRLDKNLVGADLIPFQRLQIKHLFPIPFLALFYVSYVYAKKRNKSKLRVKV